MCVCVYIYIYIYIYICMYVSYFSYNVMKNPLSSTTKGVFIINPTFWLC